MQNTLSSERTVNFFCRQGNYEAAKRAACIEGRELTYPELKLILVRAIDQTNYVNAEAVLDELGRDFTAEEHERLIAIRVSMGNYGLACHAVQRAGRVLTEDELTTVAVNGITQHLDTEMVLRLANDSLLPQKAYEPVIAACLQKALPNTARILAERIGKRFTQSEIDTCIEACKAYAHHERIHAVEAFPRV
jgi:predicted hydrocarbon binding protein